MNDAESHDAPAADANRITGDGSAYYKTLVRSGYAPVNGLRMYYEIHGTTAARPLVTIHGFLGLRNVFPSLVGNRQLITMDLQGHGCTADIDRPLTFEQNAEDVVELLNYLRIEKADFFGESFGGIAAMLIAARHPELVRRVAIYGTALGNRAEVTRPRSKSEFASLTPDHRSIQYQRENYQRLAPDPAQWPILFAKSGRMAMAWRGFTSETLKSIQAPVLIAAGDHDVLSPVLEHHLAMFRLIPNAQLAIIPKPATSCSTTTPKSCCRRVDGEHHADAALWRRAVFSSATASENRLIGDQSGGCTR